MEPTHGGLLPTGHHWTGGQPNLQSQDTGNHAEAATWSGHTGPWTCTGGITPSTILPQSTHLLTPHLRKRLKFCTHKTFSPMVDRDSGWAGGKGAGLSPEYHRDCDIRGQQEEKEKKIMIHEWFNIIVILGNLEILEIFGQFRHFKVNLGSGNNFVFVTLNFSDQNF